MNKLFKAAKEATKLSYAPYSNFNVGVAILLSDNNIVKGANIENASYGASMCAERTCIYSVYNKGYKKEDIKAMALYVNTHKFIYPCGMCRQVLSELIPNDIKVYLINNKDEVKEISFSELIPNFFTSEDLDGH